MLVKKLLAGNVYAYCLNCTVAKADKTGRLTVAVAGASSWLASGGWIIVVNAAKAAGIFLLNVSGAIAAVGATIKGVQCLAQSVFSCNADERTDVVPAPGLTPTIAPSASPSPKTTPNPDCGLPDYPGDDPEVAPDGYEWRGRGSQGGSTGNYYNPEIGESLHPDLDHEPPIGPHWDYWNPDGEKFRIIPAK